MQRRIAACSPLLVLFMALTLLSGCGYVAMAQSTATRTQSTAHVEGTRLVVQGTTGSIDIVADPDISDVQVTAEITAGGSSKQQADERLAATMLNVTRDTNRTLTVTTEFPTPSTSSDQSNLTIHIPAASHVTVNTVNGKVAITGMHSQLAVTTTNGSINLHQCQGELTAGTVNGRIECTLHKGAVTAKTTNGQITLTDHEGSLDANTVNGRVTVSLTPDAVGPLVIRTVNGRIEANVGEAFAGELEATTGNGSISITDEAGVLKVQESDRRASRATFANQGAPSSLRTSNGRITVTVKSTP